MTLYVDGKQVGTNGGTTGAQAYTGYWRIGGDNLNGWAADGAYFNGAIDDVADLQQRARRRPGRQALHRQRSHAEHPPKPTDAYGKAVYDSAPDFFWRLGETTGTTAKDVDRQQADGTYSGGVSYGTAGAVPGTATRR